ncbi:hypothetical protein MBLNU230_g0769t1 [Neophaeotheca triangularis]
MDQDDDFAVDPAIAEAMGFTSFGAQSGTKRKYNKDDGYVDPEAKKRLQAQGKGANATPLGVREKHASAGDVAPAEVESAGSFGAGAASLPPRPEVQAEEVAAPTEGRAFATQGGVGETGDPCLQAFRKGVGNERGDMVYFQPSFIEDPWKGLK